MKAYQKQYIENLRRVFQLNAPPAEIPQDAAAYVEDRRARVAAIRDISQENTQLLRQELFPLLDNIVTAGEEDIRNLETFAQSLNDQGSYLDLVLCFSLHNALITYARHWGKRNMLIRELYNGAMTLFYMQDILTISKQNRYRWKMAMLFGEAASYIKQYDEIADQETRGYIHRAMGNLALAYTDPTLQDGQRKMAAIRRSLGILTDPVYQQKSPDLPWQLYIDKSHQERTTGLSLFRAGIHDPQALREVMESAEYVLDRQRELCRQRGGRPALRWRYAYEAAQYHCGVRPLSYLLNWMEQVYMERDEQDYTPEGIYYNMFLPALYAEYLEGRPDMRAGKKEVLGLMYRRMIKYVRRMPDNQLSERTLKNLLACLQSFVEYPDGVSEKDFLLRLVICRSPDAYVSARMAAAVAQLALDRVLAQQPQSLIGALGCQTSEEVSARGPELQRFVYEGCLLHNVGILPFHNLVRHIGRSWLEEEKEMYQCHVYAGAAMLLQGGSTRPYVQAALGHHRFFNGQGGYPQQYDRAQDPNAPLTDLISAAVHLIRLLDDRVFLTSQSMSLQEALAQLKTEAGVHLSPLWSHTLCGLEPELQDYLKDGQVRAYEEAFALLRQKD